VVRQVSEERRAVHSREMLSCAEETMASRERTSSSSIKFVAFGLEEVEALGAEEGGASRGAMDLGAEGADNPLGPFGAEKPLGPLGGTKVEGAEGGGGGRGLEEVEGGGAPIFAKGLYFSSPPALTNPFDGPFPLPVGPPDLP